MNRESVPVEPATKAAPVFFKLHDSTQERAELTVAEVFELAATHSITPLLELHSILQVPDEGCISTYALTVETGQDASTARNALSFLESIFQNLFHKHPAYTEPVGL